MLDFKFFGLSDLALNMMNSEDSIFVLISAVGNIITQTSAAEKILKQPNLQSIFEILSETAVKSVKTTLKTKESIQTIEFIDSNMYRLDIRACDDGALLYFVPAENLFQGLPAHTKYEISTALSHTFLALNLIEHKQPAKTDLIKSIYKNSLRIQRELAHLQILENNSDLYLLTNPTLNDLAEMCEMFLRECKKIVPDINFIFDSPKELIAAFDKKLISHAVLNLLSNAAAARNVTEIKLSLYIKNDMVYIEVWDNGKGIPEECINQAGSHYSFSQDMSSFCFNKNHGITSGFGLSVVKRAANLHSGIFKAQKCENGGSLMQIIFPYNISFSESDMNQAVEVNTFNIIETELSVL